MGADESEAVRRREFLAKVTTLVGVMVVAPGIELLAAGGEGPAPEVICTCTCTCSCIGPEASAASIAAQGRGEYNKNAPPGGGC